LLLIAVQRKRLLTQRPLVTRKRGLMNFAPEPLYKSDRTDTLADVRQHVSRYPEALYSETEALARSLGHPAAEVEAAREWLLKDGLEVRA
jgi:hypothetical protein